MDYRHVGARCLHKLQEKSSRSTKIPTVQGSPEERQNLYVHIPFRVKSLARTS